MKNQLNIRIVGVIEDIQVIEGKNGKDDFYEYFIKDVDNKLWNITHFSDTHSEYDLEKGTFCFDCYVKTREYTTKDGVVNHFISIGISSITSLGVEVFKYEYNSGGGKPKGKSAFGNKKIEVKTVSASEADDYE